jgi:D-threonate/D-erythronate kinase
MMDADDSGLDARARPAAVIVADDLTGAADACVAFVVRGLSGAVRFDAADATCDADVVAISTESRSCPEEFGIVRVREAAARCVRAYAPAVWFKKIDSTLRGHVGAEIVACLDILRARLAIVTPAFPAMGRLVSRGMLHVTGRGAPRPIDIVARLATQGVRDCASVMRPAPETLISADALRTVRRLGARVLVCDAETEEDLHAIVDAALALDEPILWVGSAGLASALARHLTQGHAEHEMAASGPTVSGSIVFAIGSGHPVTVAQQRHLLGARGTGTGRVMRIAIDDLEAIARAIAEGTHLLADVSPAIDQAIVARFVQFVAGLPIGAFVMSGGDTAARLCRALHAVSIDLEGDVARGIPWGTLHARPDPARPPSSWPIVLKSGGFGTDETLVRTLAFLTGGA